MAVGRELNVDYVIEGSVQKKGDGLRVTAQLIDTDTNVHVWADAYEGNDPSSLQDEATRKILVALPGEGGQIRKNEYQRTKGNARADFDPYDYYLQRTTKSSPTPKPSRKTTERRRSGGKGWRSSRIPRFCA